MHVTGVSQSSDGGSAAEAAVDHAMLASADASGATMRDQSGRKKPPSSRHEWLCAAGFLLFLEGWDLLLRVEELLSASSQGGRHGSDRGRRKFDGRREMRGKRRIFGVRGWVRRHAAARLAGKT
jgi:hypothetical protein